MYDFHVPIGGVLATATVDAVIIAESVSTTAQTDTATERVRAFMVCFSENIFIVGSLLFLNITDGWVSACLALQEASQLLHSPCTVRDGVLDVQS